MKILLLEPDQSVRRTLSLLLRELGHEVLYPENSSLTASYLDAYWPDAMVMNYYQGEQTATDLCDEIAELFGELPSVLIHSSAPEHRFYALRFKDAIFLKSPFSPEELQYSLESLNNSEVSLTG